MNIKIEVEHNKFLVKEVSLLSKKIKLIQQEDYKEI
jgi:hypothetical protein